MLVLAGQRLARSDGVALLALSSSSRLPELSLRRVVLFQRLLRLLAWSLTISSVLEPVSSTFMCLVAQQTRVTALLSARSRLAWVFTTSLDLLVLSSTCLSLSTVC